MLGRRILFVISLWLMLLPSIRTVASQNPAESCTTAVSPMPTLSSSEANPNAKPEDTIAAFYQDLQAGNIAGAASLYSEYSLQFFKVDRDAIINQFKQLNLSQLKGVEIAVAGIHLLSETVAIARVVLKHPVNNQPGVSQDVHIALGMHLENDGWKINLGLANDPNATLVDYLTLDLKPQTINGLTLLPLRIERYTSKIRVVFCLENASKHGIIWGAGQQKAATLQFVNDHYDIPGQSALIKPEQLSNENNIFVDGFFDSYPTVVDIDAWQNVSATDSSQPDTSSLAWSYSFKIPAPPFKTNSIVDNSVQPSAPLGGQPIDPCSLISKQEAQVVFGKPFFAPIKMLQDSHQAICAYAMTNNLVGDPDFYVNIFYFDNDTQGRIQFESQINEQQQLLPIPTVTGITINMPDIVQKLKNNIGLLIIVNHPGDATHRNKAAVLATLAVNRLP